MLELPFGIRTLNPTPEISKYFNTSGTPYVDTTEVLSQLTSDLRHQGLTVNVAGTEYWFKDGITDPDLVVKTFGTSFSDADFEIYGSSDATKIAKFEVDGLTTATTRTFTLPDNDGTVALTSDLSGWLTGTLTGDVEIDGSGYNFYLGYPEFINWPLNINFNAQNSVRLGVQDETYSKAYSIAASDFLGSVVTTASDGVTNRNTLAVGSYLGINGLTYISTAPTASPDPSDIIFSVDYQRQFIFNFGSDATGDIPYRNSSGYLTRLAKGAEGTILRAGASVPAYSTFTIPDTISALSTFVADSANVLTQITPAAGQSIRVNAGGTAWEAYTPGGGSSVLSDITAATGANTINSGDNHQIWDWNSLTSGTGMSFRSSSTGADSSTLQVVSIEKSGANSNSTQTTTALNVSNTSTGTSATNIAGHFTASGADNNYALNIVGGVNWSNDANLSTWTQTHTGTQPGINLVTNRNAVVSQFGIQNTNGGASAETRFRLAGSGQIGWLAMAGGNNTSAYGEGNRIALWNNANAGIIFGTNNTGRAVFTNDNKFVFGATSITSGSVLADFQSTSQGVMLPRVTNTAAISTPVNGMVAYDSDTNEFIFRQNGSWIGLGSGGGIGGSTGSVDNALLRADGTGGSTAQASSVIISDTADINLGVSGISGTSGTARSITVAGSGTNIGLNFTAKGAGSFNFIGGGLVFTDETDNAYSFRVAAGSTSAGFGYFKNSASSVRTFIYGMDGISGSTDGEDIIIRGGAGFHGSTGRGGNIFLFHGDGATTGPDGNLGLFVDYTSYNFQSMQRGVFFGDGVAPSGNPTGGVFEYVVDVEGTAEKYVRTESGAVMSVSGLLEPIEIDTTTLTLTEAHRGKFLYFTHASGCTVTVPTTLKKGFSCVLMQDDSTGTISLTGATVNGKTATTAQYDKIGLVHYKDTDVYYGA